MHTPSFLMALFVVSAHGMNTDQKHIPSLVTELCYRPEKEHTKEELKSFAQSCYNSINMHRKQRHHDGTLPKCDVCLIDRNPIWGIDRKTSIYGDRISIMPATKLDRLNIFHTICYLICARDQHIKERAGYTPCLGQNNVNDYGDICAQFRDTMKRDILLNGLRAADAHAEAQKYNPFPEYTHVLLNDMALTEHGKEYVLSQSQNINCGITFAHLSPRYHSSVPVPPRKKHTYVKKLKELLPKKHSHFRKHSVGLIINTNTPKKSLEEKTFPDEERSPCYADKSHRSTPKMITHKKSPF